MHSRAVTKLEMALTPNIDNVRWSRELVSDSEDLPEGLLSSKRSTTSKISITSSADVGLL